MLKRLLGGPIARPGVRTIAPMTSHRELENFSALVSVVAVVAQRAEHSVPLALRRHGRQGFEREGTERIERIE
jgi:hypothetical protein